MANWGELFVPNPDLLIDIAKHAKHTIVLAYGAGAAMDSDFMSAFAQGLVKACLRVVRFEFPYMAERRKSGKRSPPDRKPVPRGTWRTVIQASGAQKLVIGG